MRLLDVRPSGREDVEDEPAVGDEEVARGAEPLQALGVREQVEVGAKRAEGESTLALAWLSPTEWVSLLERAGFEVEACYGWFDRSPYRGGEDSVWVARRAAPL